MKKLIGKYLVYATVAVLTLASCSAYDIERGDSFIDGGRESVGGDYDDINGG